MPERLVILTQVASPPVGPDMPADRAWAWMFVIGYGLLVMALALYAGHVALSGGDKQRRADGYKVLKFVWSTTIGVTGLIGIILRLSQSGLL